MNPLTDEVLQKYQQEMKLEGKARQLIYEAIKSIEVQQQETQQQLDQLEKEEKQLANDDTPQQPEETTQEDLQKAVERAEVVNQIKREKFDTFLETIPMFTTYSQKINPPLNDETTQCKTWKLRFDKLESDKIYLGISTSNFKPPSAFCSIRTGWGLELRKGHILNGERRKYAHTAIEQGDTVVVTYHFKNKDICWKVERLGYWIHQEDQDLSKIEHFYFALSCSNKGDKIKIIKD